MCASSEFTLEIGDAVPKLLELALPLGLDSAKGGVLNCMELAAEQRYMNCIASRRLTRKRLSRSACWHVRGRRDVHYPAPPRLLLTCISKVLLEITQHCTC